MKLNGQAAINFAKQNDVALFGRADAHYTVVTPSSRYLSDVEAQEMVDEGIVDGVWCWTDAPPEEEHDVRADLAGNYDESEYDPEQAAEDLAFSAQYAFESTD